MQLMLIFDEQKRINYKGILKLLQTKEEEFDVKITSSNVIPQQNDFLNGAEPKIKNLKEEI